MLAKIFKPIRAFFSDTKNHSHILDLYDVADRFITPRTTKDYSEILSNPLNETPIDVELRDPNTKVMFEMIVSPSIWPRFSFWFWSKFKPSQRVVFNELADDIELYIPHGPDRIAVKREKLADGTVQETKNMLVLFKVADVKATSRDAVIESISSRNESIYLNGDDLLEYVKQISQEPVLIRMLKISQQEDEEKGCHIFLIIDFYSRTDAAVFKLRFNPREFVG